MKIFYVVIGRLLMAVKYIAGIIGFEYQGIGRVPSRSLLGLRGENIKTIIDIGANQGQFSKTMISMFPDSQLIAFEPLRGPYENLKEWADEGGGRVQVHQMAIGDFDGEIEMNLHSEFTPSSSLLRSTAQGIQLFAITSAQEKITVPIRSLDSFFESIEIELLSPFLIKIDVQGFEDRVIKGASRMMRKAKAVLLEVCVEELYCEQASFKDLLSRLDDFGLSYAGNVGQYYNKNGSVVYFDALFVR